MITGKKGEALIKYYEKLHDGDLTMIGLQPKMDCSDIWTEGYGRAMRDKKGNFIKGIENKKLAYSMMTIHNEHEAEIAFQQDLRPREYIVMQRVRVPLNQNQFDALVSHTYNSGGSSTLFDLINRRAPASEIRRWFETRYIISGGVVRQGLVKRRKAEADLFFS